jgi:hypothetical protein
VSNNSEAYKPVDQVAQFIKPNNEASKEPPKPRALDPPSHQQELNVKIGLHPLGLQAESKTVKQSEFDPSEVERATAAPSVVPQNPSAAPMSSVVSGLSSREFFFSLPSLSAFRKPLAYTDTERSSPSFSYLYHLDSEVMWMPRNTPFSPKE